MKKFSRHILLTIFAFLLSVTGSAQTTVLAQSFKDYDPSKFSGWVFTNCSAQSSYLCIGNGSLGEVITPALGVNGNVTLLVKTKRYNNNVAKFRVSVVGSGTTNSGEFTVGTGDEYRPSAILIKGLTPSSKLKIEGISGMFIIKTMKVFAIDDAIFYESFDFMKGDERGEFYYSTLSTSTASASLCDNSDGASLNNIKQSEKNIFIYSSPTSSYGMPTVPVDDDPQKTIDALLTFRISRFQDGLYKNLLGLSCSGTAKTTDFNSRKIDETTSRIENKEISTGDYREWQNYSAIIRNMSSSTVLTFTGSLLNLNDVKVSPLVIFDEKGNNDFITSQYCSVLLLRTLTANVWCPLCLPFEITKEQMEEAINTTCELCTLTGVEDDVFIFDGATTIAAGTPFIVRVPSMVENPIFTGVTITNTPAAIINYDGYKFVGTYSPVDLETDGTNLFLTINGKLGSPGTGEGYNHINGLRAYFVVPNSSSSARISIGGNENVDVVKTPVKSTSQTETTTYDLQGRSVNSSHTKGLHIRNARKYLTR